MDDKRPEHSSATETSSDSMIPPNESASPEVSTELPPVKGDKPKTDVAKGGDEKPLNVSTDSPNAEAEMGSASPLETPESNVNGWTDEEIAGVESFSEQRAASPPQTPNSGKADETSDAQRSLLKPILLIGGLVFLINLGIGMLILYGDKLPWFKIDSDPTVVVQPPDQAVAVKEELLIGGIAPLTGDAASFGLPLQQAAFLAQEEINKNGGIEGKSVRIIWKDGRCQREDATIAAEELVREVGVKLLIAGMCSSEFLAAAEVAQPAEVISFSPSATSPNISQLGEYVLRTAPSDALAGKAAAEYAFTYEEARTAVIMFEDNDYTQSLREVFGERFAELGGEVAIELSFSAGQTDFSGLASQVKSANPDVIYLLPQSSTPGLLALQALDAAGVNSTIMTAEVLLDRENLNQQGALLEGLIGVEPAFDPERSEAKQFLDLYRDEYETEPVYPGYMAGMYDIMYLIKDSYEANSGDTTEMMRYFYGLSDWAGAVGVLDWDTNGDPQMAYSIKQITNGDIVELDVYRPE